MILPQNVEITVAKLGPNDKDRVEQLTSQLLGLPIRTDRGSTIGVIEAVFIEGDELKVQAAVDPVLYIRGFTDLLANVSMRISKEVINE